MKFKHTLILLLLAGGIGSYVWFVDLNIPPGQYRYAFRVDGAAWKVPAGAAVVDDDFGGKSAWLTVGGLPSTSVR